MFYMHLWYGFADLTFVYGNATSFSSQQIKMCNTNTCNLHHNKKANYPRMTFYPFFYFYVYDSDSNTKEYHASFKGAECNLIMSDDFTLNHI